MNKAVGNQRVDWYTARAT